MANNWLKKFSTFSNANTLLNNVLSSADKTGLFKFGLDSAKTINALFLNKSSHPDAYLPPAYRQYLYLSTDKYNTKGNYVANKFLQSMLWGRKGKSVLKGLPETSQQIQLGSTEKAFLDPTSFGNNRLFNKTFSTKPSFFQGSITGGASRNEVFNKFKSNKIENIKKIRNNSNPTNNSITSNVTFKNYNSKESIQINMKRSDVDIITPQTDDDNYFEETGMDDKDHPNIIPQPSIKSKFKIYIKYKNENDKWNIIALRPTIGNSDLEDSYNNAWHSFSAFGRTQKNFIYSETDRTMNLDLIEFAYSKDDLKNLYGKLNYLSRMNYPKISKIGENKVNAEVDEAFVRGTVIYLSIGNLYIDLPCIINNMRIRYHKESWDIEDFLPTRVDISMSLTILFYENKTINSDFYSYIKDNYDTNRYNIKRSYLENNNEFEYTTIEPIIEPNNTYESIELNNQMIRNTNPNLT